METARKPVAGPQRLKILIIDDNPVDRELEERELRKRYPKAAVFQIRSANEFKRALELNRYGAVLTEYKLNWGDGFDVLEAVRRRHPGTPVIMVTGSGSEEIAVEGMKRGLSDYILKEHIEKLPYSIEEALERGTSRERLSEERLRMLFEYAPEAIYLNDLKGVFVDANRATEDLTGYEREQLIGKNIFKTKFLPPDQKPKATTLFTKSALSIPAGPDEFVIARRDGSKVYVEIRTYPVEMDGRLMVLSVVRDISKHKQIEEALEKARDELEERVEKRTVELKKEMAIRAQAEELSHSLNSINMAITSTLDFSEIMHRLVVESAKSLGAETAIVEMREGEFWVLRFSYGLPAKYLGRRLSAKHARHLLLAVRKRKPVLICDAPNDPRIERKLAERFNIQAILMVPIISREEVIGTLCFHYHEKNICFTDEQKDFARKVATTAALAIENSRLYAIERNVADTLQQSLLTLPPLVEGLEIGHLYKSATEALAVGGDFYDIFELEKGVIGVAVGDVSGKGLEASRLTSLAKNSLRAYAFDSRSPSTVLLKTNDILSKSAPASVFVTVFFAFLYIDSGELVYGCGGHPPSILKRKDAPPEFLKVCSPIVGAFDFMDYIEGTERLTKGDRLLIYTDGVIEARRDDEFFSEEGLLAAVVNTEDVPTDRLPQAIFDRVADFAGGRLIDDIAILALELKG